MLSLVFLMIAGVAGAAYMWAEVERLLTREEVVLDPAGGGALNVLLIGSDSRKAGMDPEDVERFGEVGGNRADTIILAHVIPSERRGILLHFPRDLWVTVPGDGEGRSSQQAKINSAYQHGPQAMISTVQSLTGLPINHYMEVDFLGFRSIVDAIGGIDVCLEEEFYDSTLQFRLPEGVSRLDGNAALSYVRSRTATGDFGRIERQQQFLQAVVRKVGRPSVLGNPVRVNQLSRAFASNVTVDQHFRIDEMARFALQIRRVGPEHLDTYTVPGRIGSRGSQSVVLMDEQEAGALFDALRENRDPAETPAPQPPEGEDAPPPADEQAPPADGEPAPEGPCAGFP